MTVLYTVIGKLLVFLEGDGRNPFHLPAELRSIVFLSPHNYNQILFHFPTELRPNLFHFPAELRPRSTRSFL